MRGVLRRFLLLLLCGTAAVWQLRAKPSAARRRAPQQYTLHAAETWHPDPPGKGRFDASALLLRPDGSLLTVNDKTPGIFEIRFATNGAAAIVPLPDAMTPAQLAPFAAEKFGGYDCEGLGQDAEGRIYVSEEANRWILRYDPKRKSVERLAIDWTPVSRWFSSDRNASFEGVAVGGGRLYVANEREIGRIIVVDLATLKVTDSFQVTPIGMPARDVHYSDLSWFDGDLWVLCRESRCVLRVNPATHKVLAQFDYFDLETAPENAYAHPYPYGFVEGLAVDAQNIWLCVDNNGFPRVADKKDRRPTLWRCPRPDRK
jgi:DNA-binding beta-propeller fold protein YncE